MRISLVIWLCYFNPRSPRGGATVSDAKDFDAILISIHAPHEGERRTLHKNAAITMGISIHAPHEGERPFAYSPLRQSQEDFNPRSPRGGATNSGVLKS